MNFILNIDILSVGIAIAANLILGSIIFFSDKKNTTAKLFLSQTIILSIWSLLNYLTYQITDLKIAIWMERLVIFFAVPNSITFVFLVYTFPSDKWILDKRKTLLVVMVSLLTMVVTLTPLVFSGVTSYPGIPTPQPIVEPGMILFILVAVLSIPLGIYILVKKYIRAINIEKQQLKYLLVGVFVMFIFIILFNVIFPTIFNSTRFIPLSAVFTFPFVIFTFYSIKKHKLFNIKDTATVLVAFALTIVTFVEIVLADNFTQVIFRTSVFILVLIFSIRLIRSIFLLEFANDRLKELDQLKSEFVSLATHQLRSPLSSIKGYLSLIKEGDYGAINNEVSEAIDIVYKSTQNLITVVGDFLDVSRIELGKMKYDFVSFDFNQLVSQAVAELKPSVISSGLVMSYIVDQGKDYKIRGDQGKLKQVIVNLIDNAVKYTPSGNIKIYLSSAEKVIKLTIEDSGIGMSKELIPLLFNKFTRLEDATKANIHGTGLGLYVVKQMVEAHHGKVWAESDGPGKGSKFFVELPTSNVG